MNTKLNDIFPTILSDVEIPVAERTELCVDSNPTYKAPKQLVKMVRSYLGNANNTATCLVGPTGSGKTELVYYFADKLNLPVFQMNCSSQTQYEHFFGGIDLITDEHTNNVTHDKNGPVTQAYDYDGDCILLIDEVDKLPIEVQGQMFAILEGKPVFDSVHNRLLVAKGRFRIFATANTSGQGMSHAYLSSNPMDAAMRGRFSWLKLDYPTKEFEIEMLEQFISIPAEIRALLVELGTYIRQDDTCDLPWSPRTLVKICHAILANGKSSPLFESFESEYLWGYDDENTIEALTEVWNRVFGDYSGQSIEQILSDSFEATSTEDTQSDDEGTYVADELVEGQAYYYDSRSQRYSTYDFVFDKDGASTRDFTSFNPDEIVRYYANGDESLSKAKKVLKRSDVVIDELDDYYDVYLATRNGQKRIYCINQHTKAWINPETGYLLCYKEHNEELMDLVRIRESKGYTLHKRMDMNEILRTYSCMF